MKELLKSPEVLALIDIALKEDIGNGDHTSLACIDAGKTGDAYCTAKESGVIAGIELAAFIFHKIDETLTFHANVKDGDEIKKGYMIFNVKGNSISILKGERLVLNFLQRLSGIATQSGLISNLIKDFKTRVLDTRKTTPGMRLLEKYAVRVGGSYNHRVGLYDMILIKDNHIDFSGGIRQAIERTHDYLKKNHLDLQIEIETRSIDEVKQVLDAGGVNRIMLDNFSPALLKEAVTLIAGRYETEASGGITKDNIRDFAATGVDFISVGALTHSSKSIDLSMKVK